MDRSGERLTARYSDGSRDGAVLVVYVFCSLQTCLVNTSCAVVQTSMEICGDFYLNCLLPKTMRL